MPIENSSGVFGAKGSYPKPPVAMPVDESPKSLLSTAFDSFLAFSDSFTYTQIFSILFGLFFAHIGSSVIYNLYFHPLKDFPGPFWAKLTIFYEYYYDVILDGKLATHCYDVLHPTYGPLIRIAPHKLRTNSTDDYFKIHAVGTKFYKDPAFYGGLNQPQGVICMIDNKEHHERRKLMAPLFSKKTIGKLQPLVRTHIERLFERLRRDENKVGKGERFVIDGGKVYQAIICDIIMLFAFGKTYDTIGRDTMTHPLLELNNKLTDMLFSYKYVPAIATTIILSIPLWFSKIFFYSAALIREFEDGTYADVHELFLRKRAGTLKPHSPDDPVTVFSELIDLYPNEQSLANDSTVMFTAGTVTTAYALNQGTYHLAKHPEMRQRLFDEIKTIWPTLQSKPPTYEELEKLPYLTAVIKEILRLSPGVVGGLARKTPTGGASLSGRFVPEHTSIDSTIFAMNHNVEVFPEPFKFDPERWLQPDSILLEKYSVPFGLGSRNCAGMYLAYLELYLVLSAVVREWEWECTERLEEEGWLWADRWAVGKRGDPGRFYLKSRTE